MVNGMQRIVLVAYDADAQRWYVAASDIEGLAAEAPSLDELRAKISTIADDLRSPDMG